MLILLEIIAVVFTFLYLWYIAKQKPMGWLMGILASGVSVYFFYLKGYYGSCTLNIIYIFQGFYGYFYWQKIANNQMAAYHFKIWQHFIFLIFASFLYFSFLQIATFFNVKEFKNIDIALASFSIVATYIETKKDTSCWWYWIILNMGYSIYYLNENLYLYAALMLVLAGFAYWALRKWLATKAINN